MQQLAPGSRATLYILELETNLRDVIWSFIITRTFSWLKAPIYHELTPTYTNCINSDLNVKAVVAAFNQEKALSWVLLRDCENFLDLRFQLYAPPCTF